VRAVDLPSVCAGGFAFYIGRRVSGLVVTVVVDWCEIKDVAHVSMGLRRCMKFRDGPCGVLWRERSGTELEGPTGHSHTCWFGFGFGTTDLSSSFFDHGPILTHVGYASPT
jgi:hypothetical protein